MIRKQHQKTKRGFTIIEVVLVLAIAGLIFLMVFIALPALQRSQRDTQRRDDMARFIAQLSQYQANNKGKTPTDWSKFVTDYLRAGGDSFNDPFGDDVPYVTKKEECTSGSCNNKSDATDTSTGTIRVYDNATCDGENPTYSKGKNKIAITYKLEGAGTYCGHN